MATTQVLQINKELNILAPRISTWIDQLSLPTPNTAANYTVPANVDTLFITYSAGTLFVCANGSAAVVPVATITNGTGSAKILDGDTRNVDPGAVLSFINAAACVVSFEGFKAFVVG